MPRISRVVIPEIPYHITQRGNYKQDVFLNDSDKKKYISLLQEYSEMHNVDILAYCLMSNHVHFAVVPHRSDSLGLMFKQVNMRYSQYFNLKLDRRGHLWQGRYFSCPLDEDHLYEVLRYIENNPVEAGIVKSAENYPWSSALVHVLGDLSKDELICDYTKYLDEIKNWKEYLNNDPKEQMILDIEKCTNSGRPAGNKAFIQELEFKIGRVLRVKPMGRPWPKNKSVSVPT